jgi:uncharacterized protein (TIGR02594 family)
MLKKGMSGPEVLAFKAILIKLGYALTPGNDSFGELTEKVVKKFQSKNGLTVDGVVGPKTLAVMKGEPQAPAPTPIKGQYTHVHPIDWVRNEARLFNGVKEIPGAKDNPRIVEYHKHSANIGGPNATHHDEVPWCSSLWNAAADSCGMFKTDNALASSWDNYVGKALKKGDWVEEGDLVRIKDSNHITAANKRFQWTDEGTFDGCGGNQGNQIKVSTYSKKKIVSVHKWAPKPGTITAPISGKAGDSTGGSGESTR